MASTTDLAGIEYPGPFRRDDVLGYSEVNKIVDGIGTISNVIQYEMDSEGHAESRKWLRANAIYYLNGANFDISAQSQENIFPTQIAWVSAGVIDIAFLSTISDSTYEVFFTPLMDGASATSYAYAVAGDATYKTTSGVRIYVSTIGSTPAGVNPYGFCIGLAYGA
jgi:hypothetical protein